MKLKTLWLSVCAVALTLSCTSILAATSAKQKKSSKKIKSCKIVPKKNKLVAKDLDLSRFRFEPFLRADNLYSGGELLTNVTNLREPVRMLLRDAKMQQQAKACGLKLQYPRMVVSGYLEGVATHTDPYVGRAQTTGNFTGGEIDSYVEFTPWLATFLAVDYDPNPASNQKYVTTRAFFTIGNLTRSPFYLSAGQSYVPFGLYDSYMVSAPLTQILGRTKARYLTLGYQQTHSAHKLHAELYVFHGLNLKDNSIAVEGWGADLGYQFSIKHSHNVVGVSFISNLSASQGIQGVTYGMRHYGPAVPAMDVYASWNLASFDVLAEYVAALNQFQSKVLSFANHGAKPQAWHLEAAYNFKLGTKPSSIAVSYDGSAQALALGIPEQSYAIAFNTSLLKNTVLSFEYRVNQNYGSKARSMSTPVGITATLGQCEQVVSLEFQVYF